MNFQPFIALFIYLKNKKLFLYMNPVSITELTKINYNKCTKVVLTKKKLMYSIINKFLRNITMNFY